MYVVIAIDVEKISRYGVSRTDIEKFIDKLVADDSDPPSYVCVSDEEFPSIEELLMKGACRAAEGYVIRDIIRSVVG